MLISMTTNKTLILIHMKAHKLRDDNRQSKGLQVCPYPHVPDILDQEHSLEEVISEWSEA